MYDIVVVIASFNRRKLIQQTIESIQKNSKMKVGIVVTDNSKDPETSEYLESLEDIILYKFPKLDDGYEYAEHVNANTEIGRSLTGSEGSVYWDHRMTVGKCYMQGAQLAPPSKYIFFTQNDLYYLPGWDELMTTALDKYDDLITVAGYSGGSGTDDARDIGDELRKVEVTGKIPGSNMMFRRKDWEEIGAFPDYNEDNWMCNELRSRYGKMMGLIYPYIIIHCGYTSTLVGGMETERTKTGDWQTVENMMKQYPEIMFE